CGRCHYPAGRRQARRLASVATRPALALPREPAGDRHLLPWRGLEPGPAHAHRPAPHLHVTGSVRDRLDDAVREAARAIGVDGDIPDLELGRTKSPERGDYASSAGMKLARSL